MENRHIRVHIILWCILIASFVVRLYGFTNPIADWHSWRQADTSAVSRYFVQHGFDILHPHYEDISNVPSGLENPQGYRFVEFPIYNVLQAGLYMLLPVFTLEEWGRLISIFSSVVSVLFLYLLVRKYTNSTVGLFSAFTYAFLPYDIYYGRTILPDPSMSMTILGAIYFFDLGVLPKTKTRYKYLFLSFCFAVIALLLKPFALFFFLPMFYVAWQAFGWKFVLKWQLWIFAILAVLPLAWWRVWMMQYPAGIPANSWLFNGGNIRFRPAFFRWMLYERLTKLFLGFAGILPFLLGLYANWIGEKKYGFLKGQAFFYYSFMLGSILYVCIIARGNVQHDYYQIPVMPSVAILVGLGAYYLFQLSFLTKMFRSFLLLCIFCISFWFSWQTVGHYFDIDNPSIVTAGKIVDKLTPKNAKVIAPYGGDTSFLYQTNRQGWAEFEHALPKMIAIGADYLIIVNPNANDYKGFGKEYKIVAHAPQYLLLNLHQKS